MRAYDASHVASITLKSTSSIATLSSRTIGSPSYMRDTDGYLIEVAQATGLLEEATSMSDAAPGGATAGG